MGCRPPAPFFISRQFASLTAPMGRPEWPAGSRPCESCGSGHTYSFGPVQEPFSHYRDYDYRGAFFDWRFRWIDDLSLPAFWDLPAQPPLRRLFGRSTQLPACPTRAVSSMNCNRRRRMSWTMATRPRSNWSITAVTTGAAATMAITAGRIEGASGGVYAAATGIMAVGANAATASASGPGTNGNPCLRIPAKAGIFIFGLPTRQAAPTLARWRHDVVSSSP